MIRVGSTVGNYTVISKLGEGAMAAVFMAEHPRIGKRVAIKVIHPELSTSQEMVSRFFTEARAASQIHHDNVVDIQDFGQTPDGDNFIIMEYLEGDNLAARLQAEGPLDVGRVSQIVILLCEGLAAAHQGGVIHRDLKPDNIFLVRRGQNPEFPKILDFGLAKITGTPAQAAASHKTRTGSVLGTPHYMAPEQCEGKTSVDGRADIYSLGCMMYQMITGELPFPGEGFGEVLVKHLREPPPSARAKNPQVPPAIDKIILHCLAKKREWRFQTILEVSRALRDPERFSQEIGDDPRRIAGPMPGEPDPGPPPSAAATAQLETVMGGMVPPLLPPPSAAGGAPGGAATAAPEQRTMIAMAQPLPPSASGQGTLVTSGPLPLPSRSGRTMSTDAPQLSPYDLPTMMAGAQVPPMQHPGTGQVPVARPIVKSPAFLGLLGGFGLALVALVIVPLFRPRVYTITVASTPSGASVLRDGQPIGQTPLVLQLKRGAADAKLVLHKDGFVDSVRQVAAKADQQIAVRLLLLPPKEPDSGEGPDQVDKPGDDGPARPVKPLRPAKPQTPVAKPQTPVAKPQTPVAKPQTPVAKPQTPVAKPQTPVAKPQTPVTKPNRPRRPKNNMIVPF